jgi:glucosyltransferase
MKLLSVIVPCYNEEESLPYFYTEITKTALAIADVSFEFIFVDDGSFDGTLEILRNLNNKDNRVKYISFSRNFGKESAIYAGIKESIGDYVVLMDADLQHPPQMLISMLTLLKSNNIDCVTAKRIDRKGEPPIRSFLSKIFYKIINKISDAQFVDGASDFRMMKRNMIEAILELSEYNRFSKGIFGWVGFRTEWISYNNVERIAGETKWSFWKLFKYSVDGITAFSTAPLSIASLSGILFCFISFIIIIITVLKTILYGDPVAGFPTLLCVVFLIGGLQLFCIGIVGQYLAKTYLETKKRPLYLVKEKNDEISIK